MLPLCSDAFMEHNAKANTVELSFAATLNSLCAGLPTPHEVRKVSRGNDLRPFRETSGRAHGGVGRPAPSTSLSGIDAKAANRKGR